LIAYSPPYKQFSIDIRAQLSEKELNRLERRFQRPEIKVKPLHNNLMKTATRLVLKKPPSQEAIRLQPCRIS
jgi:hypothetical protein